MDYDKAVERENERQNTLTTNARTETLNMINVKDEYFEPPPKILTEEEKQMAEQIKNWIRTAQSSIKSCKQLIFKESILGGDTTYYKTSMQESEEHIKKFEAKLKELGV